MVNHEAYNRYYKVFRNCLDTNDLAKKRAEIKRNAVWQKTTPRYELLS